MRIHDADGVQRPQSRRPNDTGHHALARSRSHERGALFRRVRTGNVVGDEVLGRAFDYSITGLVVAEGEVGGESFTRSGGVPV